MPAHKSPMPAQPPLQPVHRDGNGGDDDDDGVYYTIDHFLPPIVRVAKIVGAFALVGVLLFVASRPERPDPVAAQLAALEAQMAMLQTMRTCNAT